MLRKILPFVYLLIVSVSANSQTDKPIGNLPVIIPPSPEVAEMTRVGQVGSSLFTGASNVNIPLYTIDAGSLKFPVAISYSNNGIRVGEIPGRAGLGWSLQIGGVVNREVRDEPDGESTFLTPPNFSELTSGLLEYLKKASKYGNDTEHDFYSFSAGGISGRFYIDESGQPRVVSHSNLKITALGNSGNYSSFVITTAEGVKYYFGENNTFEKTREVNLNKNMGPMSKVQKTAWFLTRIVTPEGRVLTFSYSPIFVKTQLGPVQFVDLETNSHSPDPVNDPCNYCRGVFGAVKNNTISYDTQVLTGITSSNGLAVDLLYQSRPDESGDNRLVSLEVRAGLKFLKKYVLTYLDVNQTGLNKKFFLASVKSLPVFGSSEEVHQHTFEYIQPGSIADQQYKGIDFFGYNNGESHNSNIFPRPTNYQNYQRGGEGAIRTPNESYAQIGALSKVIYPNGGFDEIFYEGHRINTIESQTTYTESNTATDGAGHSTAKSSSTFFVPQQSQNVSIHFVTSMSPGAPQPGDPNYWPPQDLLRRIATLEIIRGSNIIRKDLWAYGSNVYNYSLVAGTGYELKVTVYGSTNAATVWLKYDPVQSDVQVNKLACGIRVSKITSFDPATGKSSNKFFKYEALQSPGVSSGVGNAGGPIVEMTKGGFCSTPDIWGQILTVCPTVISISSASPGISQSFNGSTVAYKYVIESDDSNFTNGGVEHEFIAYDDVYYPAAVLNGSIFRSPQHVEGTLNGVEKRTLYFSRVGTANNKLKEVFNYYNLQGMTNLYSNHVVRKRWETTLDSYMSVADKVSGWDVNVYNYSSGWIRLDSTKTVEYDQYQDSQLEHLTEYKYENAIHTMPTKISTTGSHKKTLTTDLKYPTDFNTPVYSNMVANHIITPVVMKTFSQQGMFLSSEETEYKDWNTGQTIFKPFILKSASQGSPVDNRVIYYQYDEKGNPLEFAKSDGPRHSYIWGYDKTYPIAQVSNASYEDVAYTSFENSDKGNWNYLGALNTAFSGTGRGSYDLAGGAITKSGLNSTKSYVLTYFTKNIGPLAITGTKTGYPIKEGARGEWLIYKHIVTGLTAISIAGSGLVDEVRLYPVDAAMHTYTYDPFIGITGECDAKNVVTEYKYDDFNRLEQVRNHSGDLLKTFDYHYPKLEEAGPTTYYNASVSVTLIKNDCSSGYSGSAVTYSVPANIYTSTISQADANSKASDDAAVNGQRFANERGSCVPCSGVLNKVINGVCVAGLKLYTRSVRSGTQYRCEYTISWPDGSVITGSEMSPAPCENVILD